MVFPPPPITLPKVEGVFFPLGHISMVSPPKKIKIHRSYWHCCSATGVAFFSVGQATGTVVFESYLLKLYNGSNLHSCYVFYWTEPATDPLGISEFFKHSLRFCRFAETNPLPDTKEVKDLAKPIIFNQKAVRKLSSIAYSIHSN